MIPCATCGADPTGSFNDGSPSYRCGPHPPIKPEGAHPAYTAALSRDGRGDPFVDEYGRLIVPLTEDEMAEAEACGKLRLTRAKRRKAADRFGFDSPTSHSIGAIAERAFSKWIGEPWECTTGRYGGLPDIRGCQIRGQSDPKKPLPVKKNDPARTPVVSVVVSGSRCWIRGWYPAGDARRSDWSYNPHGWREAHAVPNRELLPMAGFLDDNRVRAAMGRPPAGG